MTEQLDKGRRLARRRVALISFGWLLVIATLIIGMLLFSPNRTEIAQALSASTVLLGTMLSVFTALILGYFTASATENIMARRNTFSDSDPRDERR